MIETTGSYAWGMASSNATTVAEYLSDLTEDRRQLVGAIRDVVNNNLPDGYQEAMQYGMIGWSVPHDIYPAGYHTDPKQPLPFAALASQKQYVSLYLMGLYITSEVDAKGQAAESPDSVWFRQAWLDSGHRLNMGKSCVRVRSLDDVAFEVVAEAIRRVPLDEYIARYEANIPVKGRCKQ